jgi:anthranilate phosphoribosyltransferase
VRTLFNILGPLTNPAGARNQVMGVFHPDLVGIQARVLQRLGSRHVIVVHGVEGLDEISISGETRVGELKNDEVREYTIHPGQFGMRTAELARIQVKDGSESRDMLHLALSGTPGPAGDILALNAGAAIYASGIVESHEDGVRKAQEVIASGAARAKLDQFLAFTRKFKAP